MKKITLAFFLLAGIFISKVSEAQVSVNVNVNVGSQPNWGPTGYDNVNYYYMPDIETYYYLPKQQFIYLNGGSWVFLPVSQKDTGLIISTEDIKW